MSSYLFIIFSRETILGGLIKNSFSSIFIGKSYFNATSFFASSTVSNDASKFSFNFPFNSWVFLKIPSRFLYFVSSDTAVLGPTFGTPGILSDVSPTRHK